MEENYTNPDTGQDEETSTEIPIQDGSEKQETKDNEADSSSAKESEEQSEATEVTDEAGDQGTGAEQDGPADAKEAGKDSADGSVKENTTKNEDSAQNAEDSSEAEKKGGFFSRNKKADKEKAQMKEKIDSLEDRVRRQMAEFDNYRKRTEREKEESFSMGEANVIEKMLPIVDNFERGFDTVEEADKDDAFVTGMKKVYSQMLKQLTDLGVKPIEAVGKPFDPEYHNAVMQVDSDQYETGTVAQELQKGYLYHDKVIRHSMVAVVK